MPVATSHSDPYNRCKIAEEPLSILGSRRSVPPIDLSWFSCKEFLLPLRLSTIYVVPFSPLVTSPTPAITTIGRCNALLPFAMAKTRKLDPPKRSVELTTHSICIPLLSSFLVLFVPSLLYLYRSRPSNFHPARDPASSPKDFRSHLRYPIFRRESSLIFVFSLSFVNRDFYGLHA